MDLGKNLNYIRSLSAGKAVFYYAAQNGNLKPLSIDQTRIRAAKSGYAEAYSGSSLKKKNVAAQDLAFSNPQFIEECYVPFGIDEIYCQFSLRLQANSLSPDVCSNANTRQTLAELAEIYYSLNGYPELAVRIAKNILMGTWLWRNKSCRNVDIEVQTSDKKTLFIENASSLAWDDKWNKSAQKNLNTLAAFITKGLTDKSANYYMDVKAILNVGWGDEIYPSQEFVQRETNSSKGFHTTPSKQLARARLFNGSESAAFHGQKIGAALQKIDDWYSDDNVEPLRVNEYGADREHLIARRHPIYRNDFYHLLAQSESFIEQMKKEKSIPQQVHFIMSILLKGGLFNSTSEK